MSMRESLDISKYFVVGPDNTKGRPVAQMMRAAVEAGFTCLQLRCKTSDVREIMTLADETAGIIAELRRSDQVALLIDDRLDAVLACREAGIKVDGVHVGQSDTPAEVCRKYLGPDAIVGLSARAHELFDYIEHADTSAIDYFGAGPLRPSVTKPDCGQDIDGHIITRSYEDLARLAQASPVPVVVGGGVTAGDLGRLRATGVAGFFVVSAIASADDPAAAARELADAWDAAAPASGTSAD